MSAPTPSATRLLGAYLRPHRAMVVALLIALLGATALPLLNPQLLRRFVDQAIGLSPTSALLGTAAAYLVVAVSGQVVRITATYLASRVAWTASNRLREDLVAHVLGLDMGFHGRHTAGELIERVDGDVTALANIVSKFIFQLLGSGLLLAGAVVAVAIEDLRFGMAMAAFLVATSVLVVRFQRFAMPSAGADREAQAQLTGHIEERLAGAEEIRALGAAEHALVRFQEVSGSAYRAAYRYERISGAMLAVTNFAFAMGTAAMLALGVMSLRSGSMTIGTVVLLFQYTMLVRQPLKQIVGQFKELQQAGAGAARVVHLLRTQSAIVEPDPGTSLAEAGPLDVSFDHIEFAYDPTEPVLRGIDLRLEEGRSLGLVGRTGSGKSTMARLLLRLYDPTAGRVLIGGVDLRDVAAESRRSRIAIVTQDVQLFGASIRDNLTMFGPNLPGLDDEIASVLDRLGLGAWLAAQPDGLDTELGSGGSGISAGEAQLLAFARVFLLDPGLVVLDEATSRLDPATEELIDRAMTDLLHDRTAVIIAHRLSSLDRVDDIAVIDDGLVVEHGTREALMADPGSRFARLMSASREGVRR